MDRVPSAVLDDVHMWRDNNLVIEVLLAGVCFLYEELERRRPRSHLKQQIERLGNLRNDTFARAGGDPSRLAADPAVHRFFKELYSLGAIGYGLWHLRPFMDSPAFRGEFNELAKMGDPSNEKGNLLRLRGQGFMFFAAGVLARDGFAIEFIAPSPNEGERRPDFYAIRDGQRFPCEATSKYPEVIKSKTVGEFWSRIIDVVQKKRGQFAVPQFDDGVLLIDCSPVFHLVGDQDLCIGGTLFHLRGGDAGHPGGAVPLLRYTDSEFSKGLRQLESEIAACGIRTIMLWNHEFSMDSESITRRVEHRVIGTIGGGRFWAYFPKAVVFPGPHVNVVWET